MLVKIKKQKTQKKCVIKRKLKFENCKSCLEATQCENKINHIKKIKLTGSLKKDHKEFIKTTNLILKTVKI